MVEHSGSDPDEASPLDRLAVGSTGTSGDVPRPRGPALAGPLARLAGEPPSAGSVAGQSGHRSPPDPATDQATDSESPDPAAGLADPLAEARTSWRRWQHRRRKMGLLLVLLVVVAGGAALLVQARDGHPEARRRPSAARVGG